MTDTPIDASTEGVMRAITPGEAEFLRQLVKIDAEGHYATRKRLPLADREQDRIRQRCRRIGLAIYRTGRWELTPIGRAAILALDKVRNP